MPAPRCVTPTPGSTHGTEPAAYAACPPTVCLGLQTLQERLRQAGIPLVHGRTAALRQLVLQAPAPVVASMLGYHDETTTKVAADVGSPWARYATGDHTQ